MKNTFLSYTDNSFAYESTKELSIESLKRQQAKNNTSSGACFIVDVSDIKNGTEIIMEYNYIKFQNETFEDVKRESYIFNF